MKVEEGKFYQTRDGRKLGPVEANQLPGDPWPWKSISDGEFVAFDREGRAVGSRLVNGMKPHLDLIEEWTEDTTTKTWGEMTGAEKGVVALGFVQGKVIECHSTGMNVWYPHVGSDFLDNFAYRIKPEPKRETVEKFGCSDCTGNWIFGSGPAGHGDTHRITFDTLDGEPDLSSIRMEKIND